MLDSYDVVVEEMQEYICSRCPHAYREKDTGAWTCWAEDPFNPFSSDCPSNADFETATEMVQAAMEKALGYLR